jgi:hypothetical protein
MARRPESLAVLPDEPDRTYLVPAGEPVSWAYRGIPLDAVEDLLPTSGAYRRATRILFAPPNRVQVCPLTPLHSGHAAILTVSGMLDGILGSGADRHVSAWSSVKITDRLEEVAGFHNVTCSLGNHLNTRQFQQLCSSDRTVYLAFDADANGSGLHAAQRLAMQLRSAGIIARIVTLPDGHDPNSFFVQGGKACQFRSLLEASRP